MPAFLKREDWNRPGADVTSEHRWLDRRRFLALTGLAGASLALPSIAACTEFQQVPESLVRRTLPKAQPPFPGRRNASYSVPERGLTPELIRSAYNNFYELGTGKRDPVRRAGKLKTSPWTLEVTGLCAKPLKLDLDDLLKRFPLEERVYRFRCVEAWAATVPWTGFPLASLLAAAEPRTEAKFVRFVSVHQKDLPGVASTARYYKWPYYEALTLAEATAAPTLVTVGSYGHALPNQHGAPVRIIVPWKYGYKSPKSVVRIELTAERPGTFWNDLQPKEYGFESNVDPKVPHPRWSQARERLLEDGRRVKTRFLNGYEKYVGKLYA